MVQVPVDRVLELVGQDAEIGSTAGTQPSGVNVYHLPLVAVGVHPARVPVLGAEVAVDPVQWRVQDREARVVVHAGHRDVAEGARHRGVNPVLEYVRRRAQSVQIQTRLVVHVPVGVLAHQHEGRPDDVDLPFDQVGHPEGMLVAFLVGYGLAVHDPRDRSPGCPPQPQGEPDQVPFGRLGHRHGWAVIRPGVAPR